MKHDKDVIKFCEENDFEKNEHGAYIYISANGFSRMNLPYILQDYAKRKLDQLKIKEDIEVDKPTDPFNIQTLQDQLKLDWLIENFDRLTIDQLSSIFNDLKTATT